MAVSCSAKSAVSSAVSSSRARAAMRSTSARVRISAMRTDSIRPAAVAGTWYPGTAGALARDGDGYVAAGGPQREPPRGRLDAIIAPHAGLMFSGPVGAYAYMAAAGAGEFETLVLVGPSHFVGFDGVALYPAGAFETPLGLAPIDEALGAEMLAAS